MSKDPALVNDLDRLTILKEEIALAEEKMKYSIAMKPIVVYMQKRVTNIKERLDASTKWVLWRKQNRHSQESYHKW